jgi:putative tRNA adenosine deaminase-associated protein
MGLEADGMDFAFAAWREEGRWSVAALAPRASESMDDLVGSLRHLPGEGGTLGFVGVADEFFVLARVLPGVATRVLLSDLNAAYEWPLADEAAKFLEIELPEDDDELDEPEPIGDFAIVADFGMDAESLELLCTDDEVYPDEIVASIATRLGFMDQVNDLLEEPPA